MHKKARRVHFLLDCTPDMIQARFTDMWHWLQEDNIGEEIELTHQTLEYDTENFQWSVWGRFDEKSFVKVLEGKVENSYQHALESAFHAATWQQVFAFLIDDAP